MSRLQRSLALAPWLALQCCTYHEVGIELPVREGTAAVVVTQSGQPDRVIGVDLASGAGAEALPTIELYTDQLVELRAFLYPCTLVELGLEVGLQLKGTGNVFLPASACSFSIQLGAEAPAWAPFGEPGIIFTTSRARLCPDSSVERPCQD